MTASDGFSRL